MVTHAGVRDVRARLWSRALAWAMRPDSARVDFAVIGVLNAGVGAVLLFAPGLARSPSLAVLMHALPRGLWAGWFLAAAGLVVAGLRVRDEWAGRVRHYAWLLAGTVLAMWLTGVLFSTGSATSVLILAAVLIWYLLTAVRLELPRFFERG